MEQVSGLAGAGPVWRQVLIAAHRDLPPRPFPRPPGIVELAVCAEGGLLPSPACPAARPERFVAGTQPTRPDDTHLVLRVDPALGCRAPDGYPAGRTATRTFRLLPPEAEPWALEAGLPRPPRDVCGPGAGDRGLEGGGSGTDDRRLATGEEQRAPCQPVNLSTCHTSAPAILAPAPGASFALAPGVPAERQRIELLATAPPDVVELTIYLDDAPLATFAQPPYRTLWALRPGRHRVRVESRDGDGILRRSDEVAFEVR
jgi:hypothetical protein